ncbi:PREDICTED: protein NRT1/ PTR FAMILY 2.7-like [Nicotiana attenuata]|uniref:Protein nrt1 ptr family 2.7 n=1 Tax=Nicotiana attenuata TaxID=49451 RepID=A0A1J6I0X8_NICAT|nr:PREDICTED: protein NRT1/ PTR FAMILY 2.7-like [Nicotiana attenuata]OIS98201.1 protein nrt1 ptr family 2.7 [Nicotiana attenuata]
MESSASMIDGEAQLMSSAAGHGKRGGWITFPFTIATTAGLNIAAAGWMSNLTVYLIEEFGMNSIDAAQVSNVMNGSVNFVPVIAAVLADSFFGTSSLVWISSFISLLGIVRLALTASIDSLRPQQICKNDSDFCTSPTKSQFALLYGGITLASIGLGGMRTNIATIGANQFRDSKYQNMFFNWFFFTMYTGTIIGFTAIVYIEDNISWKVGFYVCIAANFLGLVVFLAGSRLYHYAKLEVSPFTSLARVIVAAISKRKLPVSPSQENWYHGPYGRTTMSISASRSFRFLNRAALKCEGDVKPDGSIAKPWKLCTVSEVEDFKSLMRTLPLWSSSIFLSTPIAVLISLSVLQALAMDRHIGPHFQIPAGSIPVIILISTAIFLTIFDRLLFPMWEKLTSQSVTPFKRIGAGHVLTFVGIGVAALVESKRLNVAHNSHNLSQGRSNIVPISVLWLVPQLVIIGIGEAFHFPGQVALYYQEFPTSLKSVSTAHDMVSHCHCVLPGHCVD